MGAGMGIGMWIFWIVGFVAVLFIAKMLLLGPTDKVDTKAGSAIEILKKRYASGEINVEEFERMKNDLEAK